MSRGNAYRRPEGKCFSSKVVVYQNHSEKKTRSRAQDRVPDPYGIGYRGGFILLKIEEGIEVKVGGEREREREGERGGRGAGR